jgi:hypothetical protein
VIISQNRFSMVFNGSNTTYANAQRDQRRSVHFVRRWRRTLMNENASQPESPAWAPGAISERRHPSSRDKPGSFYVHTSFYLQYGENSTQYHSSQANLFSFQRRPIGHSLALADVSSFLASSPRTRRRILPLGLGRDKKCWSQYPSSS